MKRLTLILLILSACSKANEPEPKEPVINNYVMTLWSYDLPQVYINDTLKSGLTKWPIKTGDIIYIKNNPTQSVMTRLTVYYDGRLMFQDELCRCVQYYRDTVQ